MPTKALFILFLCFNLPSSFAEEANSIIREEVIPLMIHAQSEVNKSLTPQLSCTTLEEKSVCPPFLTDLLKDNYKGGTVGLFDKLINDGSYATPDRICGRTTALYSNEEFLQMFKTKNFATSVPKDIISKSNACAETLKAPQFNQDQKNRAKKFIMGSLVYMPLQLEDGFKNMLEAKSQVDMLLGQETTEKCEAYPTPTLINYCHAVEDCKHTNSKTVFTNKADEITNALKTVQNINIEVKRLRMSRNNPEALKKAETAVEDIKKLYPMITHSTFSESFRKTYDSSIKIDENDVRSHLKNELTQTRKKVLEKLTELRLANECLNGKRSKCNGLQELLNETAPNWRASGDLPTEAYYTCIAKTKASRNKDNKFINSALINTALILTPMGVMGTSKILYESGKLIKAASTLAKVKTTALISGVTADVTISEIETAKLYGACKTKLESLSNLQDRAPSCEMQEMKVNLARDLNSCHQQIITSAVSVISSGVGIGLTKMAMAPVKQTDDKVKEIMNEYISGLSNASDRKQAIIDLNKRLSKIAKNKEYTSEEISNALKVYLKKCKH